MKFPHLAAAALVLAGTMLLGVAAGAATITIANLDGAGEGFNDPTPATPIGGNTGTTIGQQRQIAFQFAADVWGAVLPSDVEIRVGASFDPLSCSASSAVLGSAGPQQVFSDFDNAPLANTWYPVALANKIAGVDLAPGASGTGADDLRARFNVSIDNNANCLSGSNWYYGLDGNNGSDIDLVVVLLHEFGHGLGFISLVDESTGQKFNGEDDVFSNFLFDNDLGLHWPAMSNSQRAASAINDGRVSFDGPNTVTGAATALGFVAELAVTAPGNLAGSYEVAEASFGPSVRDVPVSGNVVLAVDGVPPTGDACSAITNGAALAGNIALVDRGTCPFVTKVQAAQDAGAIGVIVVNNVAGGPTPMGGSSATITIPALMVSIDTGNLLKAELANGLTASLQTSPTERAGADPAGRPLIYTPNPLQLGSSVSHFDVSAAPNLLMEPAINSDLPQDDVGLTLELFRDLGWFFGEPTSTPSVASRTRLEQNVPNPFNPSTTIRFSLDHAGDTSLQVFDLRGRHVRSLLVGSLAAGDHAVQWDGRTDDGAPVASGIYFYRLKSGDFEGMQRMVLLK